MPPEAMTGPAPSDEAAHAAEQMILDSRHRQLDAIDAAAADSAAPIAAARFLRERALEEEEIRRRGESLERLLKGEAPTGADVHRQVQPPLRLVVGALRPQLEDRHSHLSRSSASSWLLLKRRWRLKADR